LRFGEQEETDTEHVPVTVVTTTRVLVVVIIIVRPLVFRQVGLILSVLLASIAAVQENVQDVMDAPVTLMDVISLTSVPLVDLLVEQKLLGRQLASPTGIAVLLQEIMEETLEWVTTLVTGVVLSSVTVTMSIPVQQMLHSLLEEVDLCIT